MITYLTEDTIGVTVPEDAIEHELNKSKDKLIFWFDGYFSEKELPPGNWDMIGKASELRNKDWLALDMAWLQIGATVGYKDYSIVDDLRYPFPTALESGLSLLKKHNLNPDTTIILKKQ